MAVRSHSKRRKIASLQVIESYLALVPDRGKTQGIVHVVAYILFLNYFFVVKSVKLLLLGFEMQKKNKG